VKRRDLLRTISAAAGAAGLDFESVRPGGAHEVFSLDGLIIPVPRHREIAEGTARSILRQCEAKLGKDWWR
jgi:predicted RNA binding protein YcfA (HicA-like mRNA interferase family)